MNKRQTLAEKAALEELVKNLPDDEKFELCSHLVLGLILEVLFFNGSKILVTSMEGNRYISVTESMWAHEMAKILDEEFKPLGYNVPTRIAPKFGLRVLALFDGSAKMILPTVGKEIKVQNSKIKEDLEYKPTELRSHHNRHGLQSH
ncbi:hypothetical protein OS493_031858 [Desmophyllum pertusum]|uniref:Uncharacterized protein n=1 Tax=Desmophyllum pertusum TaxID=174260 RepID=A0A9W9Y8B2_9CNID|nr:hypothetical protein OS493_031858 [Desmophyllum pertusum]